MSCTLDQEQSKQHDLKLVETVPGFRGVFKIEGDQYIDLRDKSQSPSYKTFKQKSVAELAQLLVKCVRGQMQALKDSDYFDQDLYF